MEVCFVQNVSANFFVERKKFAQTVIRLFDRHWLFATWNFLKKELLRGLEVKTMRFSIFSDHHNSVVFITTNEIQFCFFDINLWKCGVVVKSIGYLIADQNRTACCSSNNFNLHTTVTVKPNVWTFYRFVWHLRESTPLKSVQNSTIYSDIMSLYQENPYEKTEKL